jgi:hypothetical protein
MPGFPFTVRSIYGEFPLSNFALFSIDKDEIQGSNWMMRKYFAWIGNCAPILRPRGMTITHATLAECFKTPW